MLRTINFDASSVTEKHKKVIIRSSPRRFLRRLRRAVLRRERLRKRVAEPAGPFVAGRVALLLARRAGLVARDARVDGIGRDLSAELVVDETDVGSGLS